jgi:O-antigen/teichoic acid export membrane protein
MSVKSPDFGKLIAKCEWPELDRLFFRVFYQSIGVAVSGAIVGLALIWLLQVYYQEIGQRFLPATQAAILLASTIINVTIYSFAVYLRAHKQEPFMIISIIGGVVNGTAAWLLGMWYSSMGIAAGSLALNLIGWIPAYIIWRRCRKSWHMI